MKVSPPVSYTHLDVYKRQVTYHITNLISVDLLRITLRINFFSLNLHFLCLSLYAFMVPILYFPRIILAHKKNHVENGDHWYSVILGVSNITKYIKHRPIYSIFNLVVTKLLMSGKSV